MGDLKKWDAFVPQRREHLRQLGLVGERESLAPPSVKHDYLVGGDLADVADLSDVTHIYTLAHLAISLRNGTSVLGQALENVHSTDDLVDAIFTAGLGRVAGVIVRTF